MATTFSKSSFQNRAYKPLDHMEGIVEYVAGVHSGQRFSIFYPTGSPADYKINVSHPNHWAYVVQCANGSFVGSGRDFADGSATTISEATGSTVSTMGVLWQCLMNGVAVVCGQVTAANTANDNTAPDTSATVPNGNGFFHAPGGTSGMYEALDFPSAKKDSILLIQNLQHFANTFSLAKDAWGIVGTSGGADTLCWCGLAPNRAYELGSWGPYVENTVPNVVYIDAAVVPDWGITSITTAGMFPASETATTAAANLLASPARYRREASIKHFLSDIGTYCTPPIYYWSDVAPDTARFGMPFPAAVDNNVHTLAYALALKNMLPKGHVFVATGSSGLVTSGDGLPLTGFVDRTDINVPTGPDSDGVAGYITTPSGLGYKPIDHILANINRRRWDSEVPQQGIGRRWQVNSTGRFIVPPRDNRSGVRLECTSRAVFGEVALVYGSASGSPPDTLRPGESVVIPGVGPLWANAAGDSTKVARYSARELPR